MQPKSDKSPNEQQNKQLKKGDLQTQQRLRQSTLDIYTTEDRKFKLEQKPQTILTSANRLLLNQLIYDTRKNRPDWYVSINSLFNENPKQLNLGFNTAKTIESIFMSTYGFETEMLEPIAQIGCNFVVSNDHNGDDKIIRGYADHKNWIVVFPKKRCRGYSAYHSKLWLIKFKGFLRVVVSTGNLHLGDWALWANAQWWKDFKPIGKDQQKETKEKDVLAYDFKQTLSVSIKYMLPAGFDKKQLQFNLDDYDYSGVDVVLIPSIPGTYPDDGEFGLSKVKKIIRKYCDKKTANRETMTCNTTSISVLQTDFLKDVYHSFNPFNHKEPQIADMRLIYPTGKYIKQQTVGAAETLFLTEENYRKSPSMKEILYRYEDNPLNPSGGNIPHLKTIIMSSEEDDHVTFYIGSHNLTKAAWGRKSTTKNGDKYCFNNTELGLLFPNYNKKQLMEWLPFRFPPIKYQPTDTPFFRM